MQRHAVGRGPPRARAVAAGRHGAQVRQVDVAVAADAPCRYAAGPRFAAVVACFSQRLHLHKLFAMLTWLPAWAARRSASLARLGSCRSRRTRTRCHACPLRRRGPPACAPCRSESRGKPTCRSHRTLTICSQRRPAESPHEVDRLPKCGRCDTINQAPLVLNVDVDGLPEIRREPKTKIVVDLN